MASKYDTPVLPSQGQTQVKQGHTHIPASQVPHKQGLLRRLWNQIWYR